MSHIENTECIVWEPPILAYHCSLISGKLLRSLGLYDLSSGLNSVAGDVSEELLDLEDDDEPDAGVQIGSVRLPFQHVMVFSDYVHRSKG